MLLSWGAGETRSGGVQVKWQSILLFQNTAGYSNQLIPLPHPLVTADSKSPPPPPRSFRSHTHPTQVSYTPFGTAKTHQCPPLKQENSLIFGPWLPILVFLYKSYTMLHLIIRIQFNWLTLVFGHHWKCHQILYLDGALPLKKLNTIRLKIHGTAKTRDEYQNSE